MYFVDRGAVLEASEGVACSADSKIFAKFVSAKAPDFPVAVVSLQSWTTRSLGRSAPLGLKLRAAVKSMMFAIFANSRALVVPFAAAIVLDSQISIAKRLERPAPLD